MEPELFRHLSEMGFSEEDIKKFVELNDLLTDVVNKYFSPDGVKIILGLKSVGAFLGSVLTKLPGKEDPNFFFNCLMEILISAAVVMQGSEAGGIEH